MNLTRMLSGISDPQVRLAAAMAGESRLAGWLQGIEKRPTGIRKVPAENLELVFLVLSPQVADAVLECDQRASAREAYHETMDVRDPSDEGLGLSPYEWDWRGESEESLEIVVGDLARIDARSGSALTWLPLRALYNAITDENYGPAVERSRVEAFCHPEVLGALHAMIARLLSQAGDIADHDLVLVMNCLDHLGLAEWLMVGPAMDARFALACRDLSMPLQARLLDTRGLCVGLDAVLAEVEELGLSSAPLVLLDRLGAPADSDAVAEAATLGPEELVVAYGEVRNVLIRHKIFEELKDWATRSYATVDDKEGGRELLSVLRAHESDPEKVDRLMALLCAEEALIWFLGECSESDRRVLLGDAEVGESVMEACLDAGLTREAVLYVRPVGTALWDHRAESSIGDVTGEWLGCDPSAWATVWTLLDDWSGTLEELLRTAQACQQ